MEQTNMFTNTLKNRLISLLDTFWAIGTSVAAAGLLVKIARIINFKKIV